MPRFQTLLLAGLACLLCGACRDEKIVTYRIPKEPDPEASKTTARELLWDLPAGWIEEPATPPRYASFAIPGADGAPADMSVTSFPGDAGGDLANVNRWRGQIGLPPWSEAELASGAQRITAVGQEILLVELEGPDRQTSVLGAILRQREKTWFFKMTGPSALVGAQKDSFAKFLQSLRFNAGQTSSSNRTFEGSGDPSLEPWVELGSNQLIVPESRLPRA